MKHLFLLLAFLPLFASAQEDSKYLAGAVPVDDGKVVFTKVINIPAFTKDEIYQTALNWANERFKGEKTRVVYQNKEEGNIAARGEEYLVFKSTVLSLDRARMKYHALVYCQDKVCTVKVTNIHYEYDVAYQREPEKYIAEEWITDKYGLYKGKLSRVSGKFRKGTIDFVDDIFKGISLAFGQKAIQEQSVATVPVQQKEETVTPQPAATKEVQPAGKTPEGFNRMEVDKIPSMLKQMLSKSSMSVQVNGSNMKGDLKWKGFSKLFGKDIASVSADSNADLCKKVKDGDAFTIRFAEKADAEDSVWMIIECKKQGETADGSNQTVIGEVLNIWVK